MIVIPTSTLTEFTVSDLLVMEAEGTITVEKLVAEPNLKATFK